MLTLTFYDSCISVPAPRIRAVTDHKRNVVRLKLMNTDVKRQDEIMCQMIWNGMPGEVLPWVSQSLNNSYLFVLLEKHILSLFFFQSFAAERKERNCNFLKRCCTMPVLRGRWHFNCNWQEERSTKHFWKYIFLIYLFSFINLCLQVWWKGKLFRRKSCPFKDQQGKSECTKVSQRTT